MTGSQIVPKPRLNKIQAKPEVDLSNLKSQIWQSTVRSDISHVFDSQKYYMCMKDRSMGRLAITCEVFYTFRTADYFLYIEMHPLERSNKMLKLILNKADIAGHICADLMSFLFDKPKIIRVLENFLARLWFERTSLYYKPAISYTKSDHEDYVFVNRQRCSRSNTTWLEKRHREQSIVGQYVKRFGKMYTIVTVYKVVNFLGFEIEIYVPRIQKRFFFQIFNQEVLDIDGLTVDKIYQITSDDFKSLVEKNRGDYKKVKEGIAALMVNFRD
jgi:hypothetical protein